MMVDIFDYKYEIATGLLSISISTLIVFMLSKFVLTSSKQKLTWIFHGKSIEIYLSEWLIFYLINQLVLGLGMLIAKLLHFSDVGLVLLCKINLILLILNFYQAMIKPSFLSKLIKLMMIVPIIFKLFELDKIKFFSFVNYGIAIGEFNLSVLFLIKAIYLIVFLSLLGQSISNAIKHYVQRHEEWNSNTREILIKISNFILYITIFFIGINILGINLTALTVFSGAFGVGIGLSLQKISANFFSGLILLLEKNITVGNIIESAGGLKGRVKYLGVRSIVIDDFNGSEVIIPNDELINSNVKHWTNEESNVLIAIDVAVSVNNDPSIVKNLLLESVIAGPQVHSLSKPIAFMVSYKEATVEYRLEFWVKTRNVELVKSEVLNRIWRLFEKNNIKYI